MLTLTPKFLSRSVTLVILLLSSFLSTSAETLRTVFTNKSYLAFRVKVSHSAATPASSVAIKNEALES